MLIKTLTVLDIGSNNPMIKIIIPIKYKRNALFSFKAVIKLFILDTSSK